MNAVGRRIGALLLSRTAPTWRELLGMLALLSGVGALVYRSHIEDGGFYVDDWPALAWVEVRFEGDPIAAFNGLDGILGLRLVGALSLIARFTLFGIHTKWHLAAAVGLTVMMCLLLYLLLRTLRIEPLHSGAIALLVLVCPYADATRLWATGSGANIAIGAWLLGVVLTIHALQADDRRRSVALHAAAIALYVVSLLQYEVAYVAILGSGLLYRVRAPWRRVLPRAAVDVVVASVVAAAIAANSTIGRTGSVTGHVEKLIEGGGNILAAVALPYGSPRTAAVLAALAVVAAIAAIVAWRLPSRAAERRELVRWLWFGVGGLVLAVAGYAIFALSNDYYVPRVFGLVNRINAIPTIGFIVTVYAVAMLSGTLVFRRLAHWQALSAALAVAVSVLLLVGYQDRLSESAAVWDRAYAQQRTVLDTIKGRIPQLPPDSTVLTFGHPSLSERYELPAVWSLARAVQVGYRDPSVGAYVALPGTKTVCDRSGAYLAGVGAESVYLGGARYGKRLEEQYGRLYLLDVSSGRLARIDSRRQCRALAPSFRPGPIQPPPPAASSS